MHREILINIVFDFPVADRILTNNYPLLSRFFVLTDVVKLLSSVEYFISYDPYSFWSFKAALHGAVSIVYPLANVSREEYVNSLFVGDYLRDR